MLRRLQEAIIVLVGLSLCLEHLHVSLGILILTPSKAVNGLLLAVAGLEWAARKKGGAGHDRKAVWMVFFAAAVGIGTLQSVVVGGHIRSVVTVAMQWTALFLFYFVLTFVLSTRRRLTLLLAALVASACFVTVTAAMGLGFQTGERAGGWGGNVNHLAQNLLVAACAAYALFVTNRSFFRRGLLIGASVVIVLGLINTFSRAAFVAVPFMLMLWMMRFRRLDLLRYAIPAFAVLAIGFFFLPESVLERMATLSPDAIEKDGSALSRLHQFPWVFRAFMSNPLIGVGLVNFPFWVMAQGAGWGGVIHNAYLAVLAELGLVGFIPLIAILTLTWRDFSRSFLVARRLRSKRDPDLRWIEMYAIMFQIAFLGTMVLSMFHPTMTKKLFWLLFAVSTSLWRLARARYLELAEPETEGAPPLWQALQPALGSTASFRASPR